MLTYYIKQCYVLYNFLTSHLPSFKESSVVNPHWFQCGSGSVTSILSQYGSKTFSFDQNSTK
jgi:hypothetical protein